MTNTPHRQLYKLTTTPTGRRLHAYMAAILEVTGMDSGRTFPLNKFFHNFRTHLDNGRIIKVNGGYRLTESGIDYFRDRHSPGNPQNVERTEVETMTRGIPGQIRSAEWVPVE